MINIPKPADIIKDNCLVKHIAGSHAYGTNTLSSDIDYRGIFVAAPAQIRTPFFPVYEITDCTEEDTKLYELNNYLKLCLDNNPNIVETLWIDEHDIISTSEEYKLLRSHRKSFLCSKVAFTYSGYAIAQLKRIKGHKKWIMNPQPCQQPRPCDFVSLVQSFMEHKLLPRDFKLENFNDGYRLIPYSEVLFGLYKESGHNTIRPQDGSINSNFDGDRESYNYPLAIVKWNREEYKIAKEKHEQYWNWKKNRNEVRAAFENTYGFDGKHAAHLVRLLRTGKEILETGEVIVKRPDAQELLDIRNGAWTYDQLLNYANTLDKEIREDLYTKTKLPKHPNIHLAKQISPGHQYMLHL